MVENFGLRVIFKEDGRSKIADEPSALAQLLWWVEKDIMISFRKMEANGADGAELPIAYDRICNIVERDSQKLI